MPHKISYSVPIGPKHDKFGVRRSRSSDAILIIDNKDSDFSLMEIIENKDSYIPKRIFKIIKDVGSTKILTNSVDIGMTDIVHNGITYFFKTKKKTKYFSSLKINGITHDNYDANFIYTNETNGYIEYLDEDDKVISRELGEFYPIFIWEGMVHLKDIMLLDGKTFKYSPRDSKILIECSKGDVTIEANSDSIFKLHNIGDEFYINPCIYEAIREVGGSRVRYEYDYTRQVPNVRTVQYENATIVDTYSIKLSNRRIIPNSLKVDIIEKDTGIIAHTIDSTDIQTTNINVKPELGIVNIRNFIETFNIDTQDYDYMASYTYLDLANNKVKISPTNVDIKFKKVLFTIAPTKVIDKTSTVKFEQKITYTIANLDGSIVSSINDSVPLYDFTIPVLKGYGIDDYSEHGYSGVTEERTKDFVAIDDAASQGTGYSDGLFSDGPWSGSYISSLEDIVRLLSLQNNSSAGNIPLAEVHFIPRINMSKIYSVNRLAKNKNINTPVNSLSLFGSSVWHNSIDGTFSSVELAAGIDIYKSTTGLMLPGYVYMESASEVMVSFDTSSLAPFLDTLGDLDVSSVMIDVDALEVFNRYLGLKDYSFNKDAFSVFNKEDMSEVVPNSTTISADMKSVSVSLPTALKGSIIGLGIGGVDKVYPTGWLKI